MKVVCEEEKWELKGMEGERLCSRVRLKMSGDMQCSCS